MLLTNLFKNATTQLLNQTRRHSSYFITTPIFYVNSSPHIGHVHTLLLADALNIYHRLKLNSTDTLFSTGTDEHGIKIQTAAEAAKMDCASFCNLNAKKFSDLFDAYQTTATDFIRTTDDRHKATVVSVWNELNKNGFIYKNIYSGWYSHSDECFVPEAQLSEHVVDGKSVHLDPSGNQVTWSSEENYMFQLDTFKDQICEWLLEKKPVIPEKFNIEAVNMLKQHGIGDISVSRPTSRLNWGIRVPDDTSQTMYVWLDALANYLTVAGYPGRSSRLKRWPIDCQVLGKDILKFHAIYWPAFLLALGLELPRKLVCHSHWLVDSLKMSKSRGNVIDPWQENQSLTLEGLRYYLLRAGTCHSDTDYSHTQALRRVNAELADTYGNLMSRCCSSTINPLQIIQTEMAADLTADIRELIERLNSLRSKCETHFENADFYKGVDEIMSVLRFNNGLYEAAKPWDLVKKIRNDQECLLKYNNIQAITFECLRICSILLQPVVPKIAALALDRLNVAHRNLDCATISISTGNSSSTGHRPLGTNQSVLFKRLK